MRELTLKQSVVLILTIGALWSVFMFADRQISKQGQKQLQRLRALSSNQIDSVRIHQDRYENSEYVSVKDENLLYELCYALNHLENWESDHHWPEHRFHAELFLINGHSFEFDISLKSLPDTTVYVFGVGYWGSLYFHIYEAKSEHLYSWLIKAAILKQN